MPHQPKTPIYLDFQATTPVDERVLSAMIPYFSTNYGNPASREHLYGREAHLMVESARETIGSAIGAKPQDICFTSGATESINLAIKGLFSNNRGKNQHYITVLTEHRAVLDSFRMIESDGAKVTYLPVDNQGMIDPQQIAAAIRPETIMVSVMTANNEIGVIQPIKEIGHVCRTHNILFMTDATQAFGKIKLNVQEMSIDLLACSAHKIYGPKGIGALYCRRSMPRVQLHPIISGGGHERGLRSGTLNVPGIMGFARAAEIAVKGMNAEQTRIRKLRNMLYEMLNEGIPDIRLNGHSERRLVGNLNLTVPGIESEALIIAINETVAISSGSACTTAAMEPSHVLRALGLGDSEIHSSIRIGLGRPTTEEEIEIAGESIIAETKRLRKLAL